MMLERKRWHGNQSLSQIDYWRFVNCIAIIHTNTHTHTKLKTNKQKLLSKKAIVYFRFFGLNSF